MEISTYNGLFIKMENEYIDKIKNDFEKMKSEYKDLYLAQQDYDKKLKNRKNELTIIKINNSNKIDEYKNDIIVSFDYLFKRYNNPVEKFMNEKLPELKAKHLDAKNF